MVWGSDVFNSGAATLELRHSRCGDRINCFNIAPPPVDYALIMLALHHRPVMKYWYWSQELKLFHHVKADTISTFKMAQSEDSVETEYITKAEVIEVQWLPSSCQLFIYLLIELCFFCHFTKWLTKSLFVWFKSAIGNHLFDFCITNNFCRRPQLCESLVKSTGFETFVVSVSLVISLLTQCVRFNLQIFICNNFV